ncbi:hypothetical protein [Amaricoccus sp.]|uniref:hypothetical protein n=1 Tax=Amaricoccus sp. TaxID=1872485 RepID=UPI00261B0618|nr:hypothetical protein [Amaricoccus sp.]HRO10675.1 hypothetical protein [Amaricoccus sp.]
MSDDGCNIPAPAQTGTYFPDEIILYGVKLNRLHDYSSFFGGRGYELRVQLVDTAPMSHDDYSMVLAYGYAFEGHCYRFDKVRAFVVTDAAEEDPVGCGFDLELRLNQPGTPVYRMWRIHTVTQLLEVATTYDTAQALVLDANLPGRRSPNTYSINLQMAHRGGRLTRE